METMPAALRQKYPAGGYSPHFLCHCCSDAKLVPYADVFPFRAGGKISVRMPCDCRQRKIHFTCRMEKLEKK